MKAALFESFGQPPVVRDMPDPEPPVHGVVIRVGHVPDDGGLTEGFEQGGFHGVYLPV